MEKERERITNSRKTLGFEYIRKQTMERRRGERMSLLPIISAREGKKMEEESGSGSFQQKSHSCGCVRRVNPGVFFPPLLQEGSQDPLLLLQSARLLNPLHEATDVLERDLSGHLAGKSAARARCSHCWSP